MYPPMTSCPIDRPAESTQPGGSKLGPHTPLVRVDTSCGSEGEERKGVDSVLEKYFFKHNPVSVFLIFWGKNGAC